MARRAPQPAKKKVKDERAAPVLMLAPALWAVVGGCFPLTRLQRESVTPVVAERYASEMEATMWWAASRGVKMRTAAEVEDALPAYFEELFTAGAPSWRGTYAIASLIYFQPHLGTKAGCFLPRSRQALRGWKRKRPAVSRLPLPWEVVAAISNWLIWSGHWEAGVLVLMIFHFYLRPGEAFRVRVMDVVPPVPGSQSQWSIILHPSELLQVSKVKEFDETMLVDLKEFAFLGGVFTLWRLGRDPLDTLVKLTAAGFNRLFHEAVAALELEKALGRITLYRLRHAGASEDCVTHRRSLKDIAKRGRWKTTRSVRRYEKGGRISQLLHRLKPAQLAHAQSCAKLIGRIAVGEAPPCSPP